MSSQIATMPFPRMDVPARVDRLRARLDESGPDGSSIDALLVTHLVNVRYLTGFTGSAAIVLLTPDGLLFVTDGRYGDQSVEQLTAAGIDFHLHIGLTGGAQKEYLKEAAAGIARLGLEADDVTWAQQRRYASDWFPDAELVPTEGLIETLRRVKDVGEVARMAEAARIADDALAKVRPRLAEGPTEREIALDLDFEMRRLGAAGSSFETIVASGPNGAKPHHRPGDRRIGPGELVVIDFGAIVDGYCSDMTRTLCVGEPSTPTAARMVEVVAESQRAGVQAVRAGVEAKAVDEACRTIIADAGWADAFLHSTGHGVGLDIHEMPRVGSTSTETLGAGWVVTVEPGVYLPEYGGVRIEDTVVVTEEGCTVLTNAPKDLVVA
jgi:Xaa-Pro aminopeptidase